MAIKTQTCRQRLWTPSSRNWTPGDEEHFGIGVSDESGWCLGAYPGGTLVWEHLEDEEVQPRHVTDVLPQEVRRWFGALAEGRVADVEAAFDWRPGYGG